MSLSVFFDQFLSDFVILWAVIDPIGTVPVFIALTRKHSAAEKKKVARVATVVAFGVLIFFLVVGEMILKYLGIPLAAFQISGGIILFLFALDMIFGSSKPETEVQLLGNHDETAIFPLAMPSIASPGAILAIVLLTDNSRHSLLSQSITCLAMTSVILINFISMRTSSKIHKTIGDSGAIIVSKVMGLILASIAANATLLGIKQFFNL